MKKIILLLVFFISVNVFCQTLTQKYNSVYNRYEFFDNQGNLIGYKKWNSLLEQWEYYSNNVERKSSYIDPIDVEDLERTMSQLENNYDYNYQIVNQKVNEIVSLFSSFTNNTEKFKKSQYYEPVLELFGSFRNTIKSLDDSNLNFSKKSTGRFYLNKIMPYKSRLLYLKVNYEAEHSVVEEVITNEVLKTIKNTQIEIGGYESDKISEYKLNPSTNNFDLIKELSIKSKLFFDNDQYAFKRGTNNWLHNKWTFEKFDQITNRYHFYDNSGQKLVIALSQNTIIWYMNRNENNVFQNMVKYSGLIKNDNIKPE